MEPGRLQHFILPVVLLLVAQGGAALGRLLPSRPVWLAMLPPIFLAAAAAWSLVTARSTYTATDDVRSFVGAMMRERQSGDEVYVYHWVGLPFLYYASQSGMDEGITMGHCAHGSTRSYFRELDGFAGRPRVWIALPHRHDPEIDAIRWYLEAAGGQAREIPGEVGYLYDFTRRSAGVGTDAATYPLAPDLDAPQPTAWSCHGVFAPPRL